MGSYKPLACKQIWLIHLQDGPDFFFFSLGFNIYMEVIWTKNKKINTKSNRHGRHHSCTYWKSKAITIENLWKNLTSSLLYLFTFFFFWPLQFWLNYAFFFHCFCTSGNIFLNSFIYQEIPLFSDDLCLWIIISVFYFKVCIITICQLVFIYLYLHFLYF